jgi:hypothetical protein
MLLAMTLCVLVTPQGAPPQTPAAAASTTTPAKTAFERIKRLEGTWTSRSTRGWTADLRLQVIAGGSAVLSTSFDAHPGETMATLFHLDGDRLMLTHYCVAKNQPRLVATSFGEDGRTVTFTFLDATNLASRDHGHMDKAVYRFLDDDRFTSQWTWYQNGEERWMEEITSTRQRTIGAP